MQTKLHKTRGKSQPVYRQIVELLRKEIQGQQLRHGEYLPPIHQLAKQWDVGRSTIHAALKSLEEDGLVNCNTEWGKGPVVLGSAEKTKVLTILFVRWSRIAQFLALEDGVRKYFSQHKPSTEVRTVDASENLSLYVDTIRHAPDTADGIILYPWDTKEFNETSSEIIRLGVKVVFVDRTISDVEANSVAIDHFRGSYQATKHLIETHHIPVYFFGNTVGPSSCRQRYCGYIEAMHEYGYHDDHGKFVHDLPQPEAQLAGLTSRHWVRNLEIDAEQFLANLPQQNKLSVFAINDDAALALYNTATKRGLTVGRDIFLMGFGDRPFCETLPVPLSSVSQFDERTGYEAAKVLHKTISGDRQTHLVLQPELKIRKSSTG